MVISGLQKALYGYRRGLFLFKDTKNYWLTPSKKGRLRNEVVFTTIWK